MFFKLYSLKKSCFTSNGSRVSTYFYNNLNFQNKLKKLSIFKKSNSGRNDTGKIVIRTKTSILRKNKIIRANFNLRHVRLGFISSFQFIPFKNKLLSLIYFSNGSLSYYLTTENHKFFSFIYYNISKKLKRIKIKNTFLMLFQIKKLSFVSCLELLPGKGSQYSRSSGTKSRIIKFDENTHSVLVQLPSGIKKIFSYYSFVMLGRISIFENRNFLNGKAGYWRSFGFKSLVRGVAMNPVDHPHGGRTKSVKYQRTPWGKTTKFK